MVKCAGSISALLHNFVVCASDASSNFLESPGGNQMRDGRPVRSSSQRQHCAGNNLKPQTLALAQRRIHLSSPRGALSDIARCRACHPSGFSARQRIASRSSRTHPACRVQSAQCGRRTKGAPISSRRTYFDCGEPLDRSSACSAKRS